MAAGTIVLVVLWWNDTVAWTWYAFIGAAVTAGTALVSAPLHPCTFPPLPRE